MFGRRIRRAPSDQSSIESESLAAAAAPQDAGVEVEYDTESEAPRNGSSSRLGQQHLSSGRTYPSTSYARSSQNPESGGWDVLKYKQILIRDEIERANQDLGGKPPFAGIVNELKNLGVRCYIVSYSSDDVLADVRHIIGLVSQDDRKMPLREKQRCLLYRDERDRVFNLKIKGASDGMASSWKAQLLSFSGFEAIVALTVLCRTFPCINVGNEDAGVRPGYITLIIGLVLSEEIGQVLVNTCMLVRNVPSISAYTLTHRVLHDWPRKLVIFSLALASAAELNSLTQRYITFFGVVLAIIIFAANLGSRAWFHMQLKPLAYAGPGATVVALFLATLTGLIFPFVGHREVQAGGKAGLECVLRVAFLSGAIFILSDIDEVQQFLIVGSHTCNQDAVNFSIGVWFLATLITCSIFVARIKTYKPTPEEVEPILVEDHSSPVGFVVPNLPAVEIDPTLEAKGRIPFCNVQLYVVLAILLGVIIAGACGFMAFSRADDDVTQRFFQQFLP